jgi:hypothetical protein
MPKFSIKDLLIATTVVAVGLAIALGMLRWDIGMYPPEDLVLMVIGIFFSGWAIIGFGLTYPFKRPILGIVIGLVCGVLFCVARILYFMP